MSPARLTDSGGSSTARVHALALAEGGNAASMHTIHTFKTLNLESNLDIGDVKRRQAP